MLMMTLYVRQWKRQDVNNRLFNSVGKGKKDDLENSIETCIL